ncbi:MAG: GNAT family N-acetyltransferase [Myxococcota bacterium]
MSSTPLVWTPDAPAYWDADKHRIIGEAAAGVFDARFRRCKAGELLPGDWWKVTQGGKVVGFGWLDVVWGDAEITLATDPREEKKGVGGFILEHLEHEAKERGLNYLYNLVRPNHPKREAVSGWLSRRGFASNEDGSLFRAVTR